MKNKLSTLLLASVMLASGTLTGYPVMAAEAVVEPSQAGTVTLDTSKMVVSMDPNAKIEVSVNGNPVNGSAPVSAGSTVNVSVTLNKGYYLGYEHYSYSTNGDPNIPTNTEPMTLVSNQGYQYQYEFTMPAYNTDLRISILSYSTTNKGLSYAINQDATSAVISANWSVLPEISDLTAADQSGASYLWDLTKYTTSSSQPLLNSSNAELTITLEQAEQWGLNNDPDNPVHGSGTLQINGKQEASFGVPLNANYLTSTIAQNQTLSAQKVQSLTSLSELAEALGASEKYPLGFEVYASQDPDKVTTQVAAGPKGYEVSLSQLQTPGTHEINIYAGSNSLVTTLNRTDVEEVYYYKNIVFTVEEGTSAPSEPETPDQPETPDTPSTPEPDTPSNPETPENPENPFSDVLNGQWYTDYILEANKLGLMKGSNGIFNLDGNLIRGDLALILYRMAGEPEVSTENPFQDVNSSDYYYDAVMWAAANGVVTSSNADFNPENPVTRQEFVTMLTRYVLNVLNDSIANQADINNYPDYDEVADYARVPFAWAVANDIVNGQLRDGKYYLTPKGNATRAEAAKILVSFYNLNQDLLS